MKCEGLIGGYLEGEIQKFCQNNDWIWIGGVIDENCRVNIEIKCGLLRIMSE